MEFIDKYHLQHCRLCTLDLRDGKLITHQLGRAESSGRRSKGSGGFGTDWRKDRGKTGAAPCGGLRESTAYAVQGAAVVPLRLAGPGESYTTGPTWCGGESAVRATVRVAAEATARAIPAPILVDRPELTSRKTDALRQAMAQRTAGVSMTGVQQRGYKRRY